MHKFLGAVVAAATVAGAVTLLTETRVAAATPLPAAAATAAPSVALIPRQCDRGWPYEATCRPAAAPQVRRVALDRF